MTPCGSPLPEREVPTIKSRSGLSSMRSGRPEVSPTVLTGREFLAGSVSMRVLSVTQLPFCWPAPRRGPLSRHTPKASGFFNTLECAIDTRETTGHIVICMARANVREKLVTAGLDTLYRRGFNGCGVEDITRAAGVPKGSFYNYFESKEALGIEVLERFW